MSNAWWANQAGRFEVFISPEVVRELSAPEFPNKERVMPAPSVEGDAVHVAAATIHRMDYLLTWNVKHLANPNKRTHFAIICMRLGLTPPQLVTPDLLEASDDEP